jgi:Cellulase (glycosyl hydrolase family 5)
MPVTVLMKAFSVTSSTGSLLLAAACCLRLAAAQAGSLPKIRVAPDGHGFQTASGAPFTPLGLTYYRPGTGWAPQVWKRFDPEATAADFARLKELGVNCVRVFISYGSFATNPDALSPDGLAKFDQFLAMAEAAGIYVHPTGPDHWEGTPAWAQGDRIADERVLRGLESFWNQFAGRYRGRSVIFAYDLRNEPEVAWNTAVLREKWNRWLEATYGSAARIGEAWGTPNRELQLGQAPVPDPKDNPRSRELLDYQHFRESIADDWTRRQVAAIKAADPAALVTVGLIQWSVPSLLPGIAHYSAFRPRRQAQFLDFLTIHFYPFDHGFYEYRSPGDEVRNLAYLEGVAREVAKPGKPVVLGEFGWYGGGKLTIDHGSHPPATEEQQARWCRRAIETTRGFAVGWLNWGFYDDPQAGDVSQLTGLLTADGRLKAWGQEFKRLSSRIASQRTQGPPLGERPALDWDRCITSAAAGNRFRDDYFRACQAGHTASSR